MEATLAAKDAVIGQLRRELQVAQANHDVSQRWGCNESGLPVVWNRYCKWCAGVLACSVYVVCIHQC